MVWQHVHQIHRLIQNFWKLCSQKQQQWCMASDMKTWKQGGKCWASCHWNRGEKEEIFFKILKGLTRIDPTKFWEVRDARNGARLVKELATNGRKQRQSFFSYRIIQKWNLLPIELKTAPSLACFKARLDERILKQT